MSNKKILVTGSNGQLGSELKALSPNHPQFEFVFLTRNEAPLSDNAALTALVQQHQPAAVINCAAYTAVDKAESEREEAFQINATAVGVLAKACAETGARFIHVSTDYVFDGSGKLPRNEEDAVAPLNVYGESKLAGERAALENNPESIVLRTSWVYSAYGKNFVKTMLRLMGEKERITVVNDQHGSPTYAADLAEAILQIFAGETWAPGIYHYSNEGVTTWFDFAKEIAAFTKSACVVEPTTSENFPTPARRPAYSAMDKSKIRGTYNLAIKPWKESLHRCLQTIAAQPAAG